MRILASNPDTLGDLILRQPLFHALLEAGHELTLIVRPVVAPMVPYVAPGANVLELPFEVYSHALTQNWDRFTELFDAARAFSPDALLVTPYRWTQFDERLADELPGVKRIGLNGHLYRGDPNRGEAPMSRMRFDAVAEVGEDDPEVEKNAALASIILGKTNPRRFPKIEATDASLTRAKQILSEKGLTAGEYWIACVTGTAHVSLKAWPCDHWANTLSNWPARDRHFLFVGLSDEEPDARAVREAMTGESAKRTHGWMPVGGTIDELVGLTALSAGYVGHDTGPMHIAAALGKPVLAVFGGGHKLRFQPAVEPSVTVTMGVSCRGCQWMCSFEQSHCVEAVPVEQVVRAAAELESGRVTGREARVLVPPHELQSRMIRESAFISQERLRKSAELLTKLDVAQESWTRDVEQLREETEKQAAAIQEAHSDLGDQLREKEAMIRQQDEQLREKESMIRDNETILQERQKLLLQQDAAIARAAEDAERLRAHAAAASEQSSQLSAALEARANELAELQRNFDAKTDEANQLSATLTSQSSEIDRLQRDLSETLAKFEQSTLQSAESAKKQADEFEKLRLHLQQVDERLRQLEPRMRKPLKQMIIEFIIGAQHYYPRPPRPLPGMTIVTVCQNDEQTIRDTIESVIGQTHAHVQFIVVDRGSTDGTLAVLDEYRDRISKIIGMPVETSLTDALATAYPQATYDVIGRLDPGDVYEPGALTRVAEHFRDCPAHKAAVFNDGVAEDGWRMSASVKPTPDVYELLGASGENVDGVFFTTNAYKALHGFTRDRGEAAEWEFFLRLARRYSIHHGKAHVRTIRPRRTHSSSPTRQAAFAQAREIFESSFGAAGRIRCAVIYAINRIADMFRTPQRGRIAFAPEGGDMPMPTGIAPARVPSDQPVSPLTGGMPDRLLFSTRDTLGGDRSISYIYYDRNADNAVVYPPIDLEKLQAIHDRERSHPKQIVSPERSRVSPFAGYGKEGSLAHLLARLRSPYWWFHTPEFGDMTLQELLRSTDGIVPRQGSKIRTLVVGCFDGKLLDGLKSETDWTLFGTESNPAAAQLARDRGYPVWDTSAEHAALNVPIGEEFDLIVLNGVFAHLPDPLLVIQRLRQLLSPRGRIVIDTPNLDSKLLDVFGPTWSQWKVPYHRTLIGRRGLRKLAKNAACALEHLRTTTHPLATVRSFQLNELGLGAIVPDTAGFPPEIASRGVLLTGWARLLWDWRGRGDYLYAVLRAE